jgi:two-component system CheB/CheR fusion protein
MLLCMNEISTDQILKIFADVYPGLFAYVDKNLKNQFINETYREWIGKSREEILGQHIKDMIGSDLFNSRRPYIERVLRGESLKFRTTINHSKLGKRHVEQIYRPDFDQDGSVKGFFVMAHDIDDQITALNQIQESERLFRNYVEMIPHIAFIAEAKGGVTYFNERWYEFTGITKDKRENWDPTTIIHPEELEETQRRWLRSLDTGVPFEMEYRLKRKDGQYRWHLCRSVAIKDSNDIITKWVGTDTDIHDQKENEVNQQRLIKILESSSDIIGLANNEGQVLYLNHAGRLALEVDEDYKGKKIEEFIHHEDLNFFQQDILPTLIQKKKIDGDLRFKKFKSNNHMRVNFSGFVTTSDKTGEITGLATISRDLSDMRHKEKKLEEALVSRDQFLSMASHELKTPLTSLKLQAEITLRHLNSNKIIPKERQFIVAHQTNQLVGRLTRLIDDMLDVSRIRTGKLNIEKSHHELGDIIREAVFRMYSLFEAGGLLMPSINIEKKIFGSWDRFRLEQVIGNLLTNAIRYGRGRPIEIKVIEESGMAIISVKDLGYGIASEDLKRIFDRFERAIHYTEVSGMGLGLFISKEIIEAHKGHIWVESELDKGSTFFVSIPL